MDTTILVEEENRLERVGIFESLFCISKRLNKNIYLYGLNEDTKKAFIFLTAFDVSIKAFLLKKEQDELNGIYYLGCPVMSLSEFMAIDEECIVLDVYGDNVFEIRERTSSKNQDIQVLLEVKEKHIGIYGAGESGRYLYHLLRRCGINIDFFCDKNADKIVEVDGCSVIRPNQLDDRDKDCFVIIAIDDWTVAKEVQKMLFGKMFTKVDLFDSLFWKMKFTEVIWQKREKEYFPVFRPQGLYYLYRILSKKEVFFFGNDVQYVLDTVRTLRKVGVIIRQAVSLAVDKEIMIDDLRIKNAYQLVYEDLAACLIWVLEGEEENAKRFLDKSGICGKSCVYSSGGPLCLNRNYILDTHLGYIDSRGSIIKRNCAEDEDVIKVGILGGSTSDWDLYYLEKSWPECLLELSRSRGINMECICAATAGNTSSMEHIRLIRDVIWKKPDVVISYSRINEIAHAIDGHRFTHIYQKDIFDKLSHSGAIDSFFSLKREKSYYMGETADAPASVWLGNERMMHAACEEFHIPFFAFFQPFLYDKEPKTIIDLELKEHLMDDVKKICETFEMEKQIKNAVDTYPWLYDFSNIFDGINEEIYFDVCHVFERGNRLVAEKIFFCILDALISQKEKKIR